MSKYQNLVLKIRAEVTCWQFGFKFPGKFSQVYKFVWDYRATTIAEFLLHRQGQGVLER